MPVRPQASLFTFLLASFVTPSGGGRRKQVRAGFLVKIPSKRPPQRSTGGESRSLSVHGPVDVKLSHLHAGCPLKFSIFCGRIFTRSFRSLSLIPAYTFKITWVAGKTHYIADALSRYPVFSPAEDNFNVDTDIKCFFFNPADPQGIT